MNTKEVGNEQSRHGVYSKSESLSAVGGIQHMADPWLIATSENAGEFFDCTLKY